MRLTNRSIFSVLATLSIQSVALIIIIHAGAAKAVSQSRALINNEGALERTPALTIRKEVQEVNLVVTVTNHRGRLVRDLESSDFNIQDNGELPRRITHFERQANLPLRIAVVVDTSSSIAESFVVEEKTAGVFFSRTLRPGTDPAPVICFFHKTPRA